MTPYPRIPMPADVTRAINWIGHTLAGLKEEVMADFAALNSKLDEHNQALTDAVGRVDADVQELKAKIDELELDADDVAAVTAVTDRVQASIDRLKAIDPVAAEETEPAPAEGEQPV